MPAPRLARPRTAALIPLIVAAAVTLTACQSKPSKEDDEATKNTFTCQFTGERLVIRFEAGEARLLMPDGDRITLYQIAAASGVRFTNGILELRGKGMELQLIRDGNVTPLANCQPYQLPK